MASWCDSVVVKEDENSSADSETEDMDASKKAAASMTVAVGTFSDPDVLPVCLFNGILNVRDM